MQVFNSSGLGSSTSAVSQHTFHGQLAITAYFIRVIPLANSNGSLAHPLRVELYGCVKANITGSGKMELIGIDISEK